jgi:hypothetical protein
METVPFGLLRPASRPVSVRTGDRQSITGTPQRTATFFRYSAVRSRVFGEHTNALGTPTLVAVTLALRKHRHDSPARSRRFLCAWRWRGRTRDRPYARVGPRFFEALIEVGPNSDKTLRRALALPQLTAGFL